MRLDGAKRKRTPAPTTTDRYEAPAESLLAVPITGSNSDHGTRLTAVRDRSSYLTMSNNPPDGGTTDGRNYIMSR